MYFIWSKPYKTVIYIKLTSFDAGICAEQEKSHIFNNKWVIPIGIAHFLHHKPMFAQMSKEEQEIMIELAKRMQTEEPEKLLKEIKQRLNINDV